MRQGTLALVVASLCALGPARARAQAGMPAEPPPPEPEQPAPPGPPPAPAAPQPAAPEAEAWRPHAGNLELRLSPPLLAGFGQGIGYYNLSCDRCTRSNGVFTLSLLGGVGYLVSDIVEVGGTLDFLFGQISDGGNAVSGYGFGLGPFLRFWVWLGPRAALVPELSAVFRLFNGSDGTSTTFTGVQVLAQIPIEYFVAPHWSLRIGPGYQFFRLSGDNASDVTLHAAVVNWAIATYF